MQTSTRGIWLRAGSRGLGRYDKLVLRHPHGQPRNWRADKDLLLAAVLDRYPDAENVQYKGGVLRFRWNAGEGSGEAYESGVTAGAVDWEVSAVA